MPKEVEDLPVDRLKKRTAPTLDLITGVRVLDLTSSIAGPYAGQLLADLGATVIKIERPGGDDARAWGPPFLRGESLWFMSVNRGKLSMTLDYSTAEGRDILLELIDRCDVILLNITPRVQRKIGLDAATLRLRRSSLIHVSVTGFGSSSSRADLPCYDLIAEGYSGIMDMTGEPDSPPQKVGTPAADMLAGQDAAMGVLAALLRRQRTGQGCDIDVAMIESMSRFMSPRILSYLGSGQLVRRSGGRDSVIAIYQAFETSDEPITLGLGNDVIWQRFWESVGQPEIAQRPEYANNTKRRDRRPEIVAIISAILRERPRAYWLDLFQTSRVPAGPIQRLDELAADEALRESGFLYSIDGSDGPIPQIGLGIRFDGRSEGTELPPPVAGAHTQDVLRDLGDFDATALERLRTQGII
jgi:crotonobetainyl-CoA:carnitine CoA-transferase CaiB-like acyl-CoA transferase